MVHHGPLAYPQLAKRVRRLLKGFRFPAVTMVHLEDLGCLQGEG